MILRRLLTDLLGRRDWREDVSAYLDDELTASERARVEARLAQSEEMRAYLDDLRDMRSVLRSFASESVRAPFQITPEMLNTRTATQIRPGAIERALRVSMTTAAIGVATFSAVLIFDAVDRPSVAFTPTAAGDQSTSVPTAQIVTDQVEQEVAGADDSSVASVTVVSIESGEPDQAAQQTAAQEQQAQQAQAFELEEAEQEAQEQAVEEEQYQQEYQEQYHEQDYEQAANDPSRRALTAGRANGASEQETVNAEDVVARPDEQAVEQTSSPVQETSVAEVSEPEVVSARDEEEAEPQVVQVDATSETRTVATSVRHVETEWPLEQRPQTSSVRVATDPAWEAPVQIVLAIIAFGATMTWFLLTVMDRRRQT